MPLIYPALVERAREYGERPAIIDAAGRHSYRQLEQASRGVARRLLQTGRDLEEARVAFLISPGFDHGAVQWGIWRAGGIAVPLPVTHPASELDYLIRDAEASIVISDPAGAERLTPLAASAAA